MFGRMPSLLGNRKSNTSMDTLAGPVLLSYMATNSRKSDVSIIRAGFYIKKSQVSSASSSSGKRSDQFSSVSEYQEITSVPAMSEFH
jgi:hypothetical protein